MGQATSKERGDLLEDVVAALHEFPTIETQKRVFLPVIDSGSVRTREIDVLLLSNVAGYPVRIAIECKNEKDPVGIQRIDEFLGKLNDVGIPPSHAVFVSPVGYTGPALERAAKAGIRTLQLDGLTQDRTRSGAQRGAPVVYLSRGGNLPIRSVRRRTERRTGIPTS